MKIANMKVGWEYPLHGVTVRCQIGRSFKWSPLNNYVRRITLTSMLCRNYLASDDAANSVGTRMVFLARESGLKV